MPYLEGKTNNKTYKNKKDKLRALPWNFKS